MSLIEYTFDGERNKVEEAIERIKAFEPKEGYYVAFSGGKDSVTVLRLVQMAGVKYDAHYRVTSVDPPELVAFIRDEYPEVERVVPRDEDGNPVTMWNLIPKKLMPPTRLVRYCCEKLKENGGYRRLTITGVRWAESQNRKANQGLVTVMDASAEENGVGIKTRKGGVILNSDNDEARSLVDTCYLKRKTVLNPIIDWEDEDVWEFIKEYKVPYCKLYDEGFKRIGCIGCPMGNGKNMKRQFERWPVYRENYARSFGKMLKAREEKGLKTEKWDTVEDVFAWWTGDDVAEKPIEGQIEMEF